LRTIGVIVLDVSRLTTDVFILKLIWAKSSGKTHEGESRHARSPRLAGGLLCGN
jgi:hypothetical protein